MSCYGYVSDMFRKAIKCSDSIDDIKGSIKFLFESCENLNVPIETQWRCAGIIFDQFRKGEL